MESVGTGVLQATALAVSSIQRLCRRLVRYLDIVCVCVCVCVCLHSLRRQQSDFCAGSPRSVCSSWPSSADSRLQRRLFSIDGDRGRVGILSALSATARIVCGAGSMYGTVSVRLSVRLSQHGPTAANPLLQVCCCRPEATDCCTAGAQQQRAAGECGQCHVVGVCKKLNSDFVLAGCVTASIASVCSRA